MVKHARMRKKHGGEFRGSVLRWPDILGNAFLVVYVVVFLDRVS